MSTRETSLTNYHVVDPMQNRKDRIPVEDLYSEQYAVEEARAYQRLTNPGAQTLGEPVAPEPSPTYPKTVPVDISFEGLALNAEAAKRIPAQEVRDKIFGQLKGNPSLRSAVNSVLSTVTGGVLSLDA